MTDQNDKKDLPLSTSSKRSELTRKTTTDLARTGSDKLSAEQKVRFAESIAPVVGGGMEIAKGLVEIRRIRVSATADVDRMDAETRKVVATIREEIDRLEAEGKETRERGGAVVAILDSVGRILNESDLGESAERDLINQLQGLVQSALERR